MTPDSGDWDEADNIAGAQFRYRSATDRQRIVERIAFGLAEQRERTERITRSLLGPSKPLRD